MARKLTRTPTGRLINSALFIKDAFNERSTPAYKLEMAFDADDVGPLVDAVEKAAEEKWGKGAAKEIGKAISSPFLDGNALAAKRAAKGKSGDVYAGKVVIRASTIYNSKGDNAPGGVLVVDEGNDAVMPGDGTVYNGCFGRAAVTIGTYEGSSVTKGDGRGLKFFLVGFQKQLDGEPLGGDSLDPFAGD